MCTRKTCSSRVAYPPKLARVRVFYPLSCPSISPALSATHHEYQMVPQSNKCLSATKSQDAKHSDSANTFPAEMVRTFGAHV